MENFGTFVVIIVADSTSETSMGYCKGQRSFRTTVSPPNCVIVASTRSEVSILKGKIDGISAEIMLHSGSSISLLRQEIVFSLKGITRRQPPQKLKLVERHCQ